MRRADLTGRVAAALAVAVVALFAGACGSDEREFGAEDFVAEANDRGAGLELGEPLTASDPRAELYALTFTDGADAGAAAEGSGGSLRVTDDSEAAQAEFVRCRQGGLICYRAANVVISLQQESEPKHLDRLVRAVRRMKSE